MAVWAVRYRGQRGPAARAGRCPRRREQAEGGGCGRSAEGPAGAGPVVGSGVADCGGYAHRAARGRPAPTTSARVAGKCWRAVSSSTRSAIRATCPTSARWPVRSPAITSATSPRAARRPKHEPETRRADIKTRLRSVRGEPVVAPSWAGAWSSWRRGGGVTRRKIFQGSRRWEPLADVSVASPKHVQSDNMKASD